MKQDALNYINNLILKESLKLSYIIKPKAPSTEKELLNESGLVIWSGASDQTIYKDPKVNYAFRAIHDNMHIKTGLDFSIDHEVELAKIQASKYSSDLIRELIFCEIGGQALHFQKTGNFIIDQVEFTLNFLKQKRVI